MRCTLVLPVLLLSLCVALAKGVIEPKTGIEFPSVYKLSRLTKLGVRYKGPIKVYAVGQYDTKSFILKMNFSVKSDQIASALIDALKPRCTELGCTSGQITQFKDMLLSGLPEGAPKGMQLVFSTGGGNLSITINDKIIGYLKSKKLASAFAGIYTDKKAVCKMVLVKDAKPDKVEWDDGLLIAVWIVIITTVVAWMVSKRNKHPTGVLFVTVSELNVYPVKSCAEQKVTSVKVTPRGFQGDRILQVTDSNGKYCTPRDRDKAQLFWVSPCLQRDNKTLTLSAPEMDSLTLNLETDASVKTVMVDVIETPDKKPLKDYGNQAAKWMEAATGIPKCRVTGIGTEYKRHVLVNEAQGDAIPTSDAPVSLADEAPFLLTSTSSLVDLNRRLKKRGKTTVDMRRFRPNIVVEGLKPWEEDSLSKIKIGSAVFHVWQRCGRCTMTTIDRDTLKRGPEPLTTLSIFRERKGGMRNFGMHLIPELDDGKLPSVSVGDKMEVLEYDEKRRAEWKLVFDK